MEIAYSGTPSVKAGGGYKKLTLKIDEQLGNVTDKITWIIDGVELQPTDEKKSSKVSFENYPEKFEYFNTGTVLKIKCTNDYSLIGSTFVVTASVKDYGSKSLLMEVTSL